MKAGLAVSMPNPTYLQVVPVVPEDEPALLEHPGEVGKVPGEAVERDHRLVVEVGRAAVLEVPDETNWQGGKEKKYIKKRQGLKKKRLVTKLHV